MKQARTIWTTGMERRMRELCGTMSLEDVAAELGVTYHSAKNKAQKLKLSTKFKEQEFYAFFSGDKHLITGTTKECAELLGITEHSVHCYVTPSHKERFSQVENKENAITAYRIN